MPHRTPYDEPLRKGTARVRELKAALEKAQAAEMAAKTALDTAGEGLNAWSPEYRVGRYEARRRWVEAREKAEEALQAWKDARRDVRSLRTSRSRWEADRGARLTG